MAEGETCELRDDEIPPDDKIREQYKALMKVALVKVQQMLKKIWLPTEGTQHQLVVRLVRKIAGLPPSDADLPIFQAFEVQKKYAKGPVWYCVVSDKKIGILPEPDVSKEVTAHLPSQEVFDVSSEQKDAKDGRKYFCLNDGRGWVAECSRKDPNKVVVAAASRGKVAVHQKKLKKQAAEDAAPAADAAAEPPATKASAEPSTEATGEPSAEAKEQTAPQAPVEASPQVVPEAEVEAGPDAASADTPEAKPLEPAAPADAEAAEADDEAPIQRSRGGGRRARGRGRGRGSRAKAAIVEEDEVMELPPEEDEVVELPKEDEVMELPPEETAVTQSQDDEVIELPPEEPVVRRGTKRRGRGGRGSGRGHISDADIASGGENLDSGDDLPLKPRSVASKGPSLKAAMKALSKQNEEIPTLQPGEIPEESVHQYRALYKLPEKQLQAMLKAVWLPLEGSKHAQAVRLVRQLAGLQPTEEDAPLFKEQEREYKRQQARDRGVPYEETESEQEGPTYEDVKREVKRYIIAYERRRLGEETESAEEEPAEGENEQAQKEPAVGENEPVEKEPPEGEDEPAQKEPAVGENEPAQKEPAAGEQEPAEKEPAESENEPISPQPAVDQDEPAEKEMFGSDSDSAGPDAGEHKPAEKSAASGENEPAEKEPASGENEPAEKEPAEGKDEAAEKEPPGPPLSFGQVKKHLEATFNEEFKPKFVFKLVRKVLQRLKEKAARAEAAEEDGEYEDEVISPASPMGMEDEVDDEFYDADNLMDLWNEVRNTTDVEDIPQPGVTENKERDGSSSSSSSSSSSDEEKPAKSGDEREEESESGEEEEEEKEDAEEDKENKEAEQEEEKEPEEPEEVLEEDEEDKAAKAQQADGTFDSKSSRYFVDDKDQLVCKWQVDYGKRTAKCRDSKCLEEVKEVQKGDLRIGRRMLKEKESGAKFVMTMWHHARCMFNVFKRTREGTRIITNERDMEGFGKVKSQDRALLRELIAAARERPPPAEGEAEEEDGPPKKKKRGDKKKEAEPPAEEAAGQAEEPVAQAAATAVEEVFDTGNEEGRYIENEKGERVHRFKVGYASQAKPGHPHRTVQGAPFKEGDLRVGRWDLRKDASGKKRAIIKWFHATCMFDQFFKAREALAKCVREGKIERGKEPELRTITHELDIEGFAALKPEDQAQLRELIAKNKAAEDAAREQAQKEEEDKENKDIRANDNSDSDEDGKEVEPEPVKKLPEISKERLSELKKIKEDMRSRDFFTYLKALTFITSSPVTVLEADRAGILNMLIEMRKRRKDYPQMVNRMVQQIQRDYCVQIKDKPELLTGEKRQAEPKVLASPKKKAKTEGT